MQIRDKEKRIEKSVNRVKNKMADPIQQEKF